MTTKKDFEKLAASAGATLEEDEGYRDMRVFQLVAPDGRRWADAGPHLLVNYAKGGTESARRHNDDEFRTTAERVASGMEDASDED